MNKLLFITILSFVPYSISIAELYKWTDDHGKVHYSDKSPDEDMAPLDHNKLPTLNHLPPPPLKITPDSHQSQINTYLPDHGEFRSNLHSISGRLLFDGKPLKINPKSYVSIWLRDESSGKSANIQVDFNVRKGSIYVENLPPGEYGMSINIDSNKSNPPLYPGDYRTWANFKIKPGYSIKRDLDMVKIIHLTEPQDNNQIIKKWSNPCGNKMSHISPVTFRWDSLGNDVIYHYRIRYNECEPYKFGELVEFGNTTDTHIMLKLPRSEQNRQYMISIMAIKENRQIGSLMTHGDNGYGWDYRFLVY